VVEVVVKVEYWRVSFIDPFVVEEVRCLVGPKGHQYMSR
jgi:hypothetical protein